MSTESLKSEFTGLLRYIQRVRSEIAAIHHPHEEDHHFESMGEQLDAIVKTTEQATTTIMEAMEANDEAVDKLRAGLTDPEQTALLDKISQNGMDVFEACSFQDITGQRVNKVVKSITYVEQRVEALVAVWGESELAEIEVEGVEKTESEALLHGPQLEGEGLSQDDIDSLFD